MLHWSLMFLIFALIAAVLGFGGLAGAAVGIAKILFFVFLVDLARCVPHSRPNSVVRALERRPTTME